MIVGLPCSPGKHGNTDLDLNLFVHTVTTVPSVNHCCFIQSSFLIQHGRDTDLFLARTSLFAMFDERLGRGMPSLLEMRRFRVPDVPCHAQSAFQPTFVVFLFHPDYCGVLPFPHPLGEGLDLPRQPRAYVHVMSTHRQDIPNGSAAIASRPSFVPGSGTSTHRSITAGTESQVFVEAAARPHFALGIRKYSKSHL